MDAPNRARYGTAGRTIGIMEKEKSPPSLAARALAVIVLLLVGWFLLRVVIGVVAGIAWVALIVFAIVAALWAWRTLTSSSS